LQTALQMACDVLASSASRITQMLNDWDTDRNGLISKTEFRKACKVFLLPTAPRDVVDALFDHFDEDGSGNLDHNELVLKARRAAFQRGFIPRKATPPPNAARKLDIYWEKRNRETMERHVRMAEQRDAEHEQRRRERIDDRRAELQHQLRQKREESKQRGLRRQEKFWLRREKEDRQVERVHKAVEKARDGIAFLPELPAAKRVAQQTWARDHVRERSPDRREAVEAVEKLQDVWAGSIIFKWKQPEKEEVALKKLIRQRDAGRGRAPSSKAFARIEAQRSRLQMENLSEYSSTASPKSSARSTLTTLTELSRMSHAPVPAPAITKAAAAAAAPPPHMETHAREPSHQPPVTVPMRTPMPPQVPRRNLEDTTPRTVGGAEVLEIGDCRHVTT
jgi:hypothetical protein